MYQVKHFPKKSEFCHLGRGGGGEQSLWNAAHAAPLPLNVDKVTWPVMWI